MRTTEAFQLLELKPTRDKKLIKKAYAAAVRKYHPEDHPEEWAKIKEAYELLNQTDVEMALPPMFADGRRENSTREKDFAAGIGAEKKIRLKKEGESQKPENTEEKHFPRIQEEDEQGKDSEWAEMESLFTHLDELSPGSQKPGEEELEKALSELNILCQFTGYDREKWKEFLHKYSWETIRSKEFLLAWKNRLIRGKLEAENYYSQLDFLAEIHEKIIEEYMGDSKEELYELIYQIKVELAKSCPPKMPAKQRKILSVAGYVILTIIWVCLVVSC